MDSRSDSLAARLKKLGIFEEYFAWWLQARPSFSERLEWLDAHECTASAGAVHRLHRSPEAAEWRAAEAARARAAMEANLPADLDSSIRKALLDQRFSAVMGDLSHKELMDHLMVEQGSEALRIKQAKLDLDAEKVRVAQQRLVLDKARQQLLRIAEDGLTEGNRDGVSALLSELEALGVK